MLVRPTHSFRESCVCPECADARRYRNLSALINKVLKPFRLHLWVLTRLA
jgi:hypothetical protein